MVELAVAGEPRLRVDRSELARGRAFVHGGHPARVPSGSARRRARAAAGRDAAAELPQLARAGGIPSLARVVVFARAGSREGSGGSGAAGRHFVHRRCASGSRGRSIRYWVPDAVADYIAAHRLYREDWNDDQDS